MLPDWVVYVVASVIAVGSYNIVRKFIEEQRELLRKSRKKIEDRRKK